jgi:hypothetical protein
MTPLETRLVNALDMDVARFDFLDAGSETRLLAPERMEHDLLPLRLADHRPRGRRTRTASAVAAAVLMCLGIVAIASRRDDGSPESDTGAVPPSSTPPVVPPGVEQPLVETSAGGLQDAYKPGSVHAFSISGHPDLLIWTTLRFDPLTGKVDEWQCVSEAGGSGCGPTSIPAQFGQTSSIDNHVASDDLFTWSNLPSEVDTVRYDDGVAQLWQRPVAGLVIFRVDPNHPHPSIKAFDATGAALPYSFWGDIPEPTPKTETTDRTVTVTPATGSETWGELESLTESSLHECVTTNSANSAPGSVPSLNAGIDPVAIWNSCVVEVKSIVAARLAELNTGS